MAGQLLQIPKSLPKRDLLNVDYSILAGNELPLFEFLTNERTISKQAKAFVISQKNVLEKQDRLKKADLK